MRIGLAIVVLMAAAPAWAQGNNAATQRVHEEARRFLQPCDALQGEPRAWCETNHRVFTRDYQSAKAGDYQGQRNVSAFLEGRGTSRFDFRVGIEVNTLQSCAWALVVLQSGHARADESDVAYARRRCNAPAVDRTAAEARAAAILAEIQRSPASMPVERRTAQPRRPTVTTSLPEDHRD